VTGSPADKGDSDTAATLTSVTGSGGDHGSPDVVVGPQATVHPYLHVVAVAVIAAVSVLVWLVVYTEGTKLLWDNAVVAGNTWLFPVICIPFSLLVGLLGRYLDAPNNINGSAMDSMLAGDTSKIDWRRLPISVITPLASLFSGAVLGPEGGIGGIASEISALYADKIGIPLAHRAQLLFSSVASSYNGLIANPVFTGVLGTELIRDPVAKTANLPSNLLGGAIGFVIFTAVGYPGLGNYLHLTSTGAYQWDDLVIVVLVALLGLVLALVAGALFRVSGRFFGRFADRVVLRALIAGVIFSVVGVVAPIVMFSGEDQVQTVVADAASYGIGLLLLMALVKLALLAVAFKSGFFGGPTFPAIFASVCVALALSLAFPGLRLDVLIAGVMAGFLVVLFRAPFMVILLTSFMLQASVDLTALIVIAVATVLIVQPYLLAAIAARQAARAGSAGAAPAA
jgi:H+/Cl- antiporter ClcA